MNKLKQLAVLTLAVAGATTGGLAQARDNGVQWSVTLASPFNLPLPPVPVITISRPAVVVQASPRGRVVYEPVYEREYAPVYGPAYGREYGPAPVYYRHGHADRAHYGRGDADHDGIPNRDDRVYNPRWDRDGDGIPNRYDHVYNPRGDRDGDGVPNRYDRHDRNPNRR